MTLELNLRKGLLGHWTMNDSDTSNGTLYDRSVYNNHGVNRSGVVTGSSGVVAESYEFDGSNANVDTEATANSLSLEQPLSIAFWIYINGGASQGWVMGNYDGNDGGGAIVYDRSEVDGLSVYDGRTGQTFNTHTIEKDVWHHVTLTGSNDTYELFVDYVSLGQTSTSEPVFTNTSFTFRLGRGYSESGNAIDGRLDDVRIYDRVLSANEVRALYNMRSQRNASI